MANYTHVQFISWEVYTGPNRGSPPWSMAQDGISYTGIGSKENAVDNRLDIAGQIEDIEARLAFTFRAVEAAAWSKYVEKKPDTLKVFMAPEFLYRGKGGAYIHDLINGWNGPVPAEFAGIKSDPYDIRYNNYPGLFGHLQRFATVPRYYEHWLFVFGTAISASFPARFKTNEGLVLDSTQPGEIYNTALVQRGWWGGIPSDAAYASRKHYIASTEPITDFIKSQYNAKGFTMGDVIPADRLDLEPNESNREGSATFTINGINEKDGQPIMFGLEVCLDHARSTPKNPQPKTITETLPWGRIRTADKWVKIQLVPSGGMYLKPASIRLAVAAWKGSRLPTLRTAYAFNCDGLFTLYPNSEWGTVKPQEWGAHTQIWNANSPNQNDPPPRTNQLINASYGQEVSNSSIAKVDDNIRSISASDLWDLGSGYVRVMQKMPL
jgi:hypothetical protein